MRILLWHVHGSWTTAFVQGRHEYLLPVNAARDADGLGRARTWDWPASVTEHDASALADLDFDVVVVQRPSELDLVRDWTGRTPGVDVPAVYLEHNTPSGDVPSTVHPVAGTLPIVHVTYFNQLIWDSGASRTRVIEHGIVDPGHRFTGEWPRAAVVMNDPVRRTRHLGTDLLVGLSEAAPLDVFGMRVDQLRLPIAADRLWTFEDLPQHKMHEEVARRRVYVHTARWTSLGLSLLEAMHLGLPVVAVAATEVPSAVPSDAGVVSADLDVLHAGVRRFIADPELAREVGLRAREAALARYGLARFLVDWEDVLAETVGGAVG